MRDVTCRWRNCTRYSTLITLRGSYADQRVAYMWSQPA